MGMIRSVVVHNIPRDSFVAMERWYYRDHAAEIVWRYGVSARWPQISMRAEIRSAAS